MFTHLHPDHVGWNLRRDAGGHYHPAFPRARYLAHRADWDTMHRPEVQQALSDIAPGFTGQALTPLQSLGVLDLTDGGRVLSQEITAIHTPGHTPGSMSLLISSNGERAILTGDAFGHPAQVEHPDWYVVHDMDHRHAEQTRYQLLDRIEAEGLVMSASHFPEPGFGRVMRLEGRRFWQALSPRPAGSPSPQPRLT